MNSLTRKSLIGLIQLQVVIALFLFLPAGSLSFWRGWVYWFLLSICVIAITLYFLKFDPHLIEGRLAAGPRAEHKPEDYPSDCGGVVLRHSDRPRARLPVSLVAAAGR